MNHAFIFLRGLRFFLNFCSVTRIQLFAFRCVFRFFLNFGKIIIKYFFFRFGFRFFFSFDRILRNRLLSFQFSFRFFLIFGRIIGDYLINFCFELRLFLSFCQIFWNRFFSCIYWYVFSPFLNISGIARSRLFTF